MRNLLIIITLSVAFSMQAFSQGVIGKWKTIDDETGKKKSIVKIYKGTDGKVYGKVTKLFREPHEVQDPVCEKCSGSKKGKKVMGMVVVWGLSKKGDTWAGGKILDPAKGKEYSCKIWLKDGDKDVLNVRGYWGMFFRTQTWYRIKE